MRRWHAWTVLSLLGFLGPVVAQDAAKTVRDFRLPDTGGKTWVLSEVKEKKAVVVVFLGTQCPVNNAYLPRLAELHKKFSGEGVQFFAINSNQNDSPKAIALHADENKIPFPVLRDNLQKVADQFGAVRTPEAFVLDGARKVVYQGRIDDQYGIGYMKPKAQAQEVADAVSAVLAGEAVKTAAVPASGCFITRAPLAKGAAPTITYSKHVADILRRNCQECHRPGQIGPMPLLSYDDASSWSTMIREVVEEKRMPPWHADPRHGKFANNRSLSKNDYDTLLGWIDQGCAQGEPLKAVAPPASSDGWTIGKPDVILTMPTAYKVPATSARGIPYQHFVMPTNFTEDKWAQAIEVKPSARAVVHHIIAYATGDSGFPGRGDIGKGMVGAYAPGDLGYVFPPGTAKKIAKGAYVVFQVHYTPNGVEQLDRSSIGIVFAKEPPTNAAVTIGIAQRKLSIAPGADNHIENSVATFKEDTLVWSLLPHMHLRGKSFEYKAVFPDGTSQILLSVPKYDFNWQSNYRLAEPLKLPAGSRIECRAGFDNSRGNLSNPDPTRLVRWGPQTWDEMMIGFVDYTTIRK